MIETIQNLNHLLATFGLVGIGATILIAYDLFTERRLQSLVTQWGLKFALIATIGASSLTLFYSEVFGIVPCGLCWFERIALYPQMLLIGTALVIRDKTMPVYGIVLSIFGLIVSAYHHYIQMGGSQLVKCPASGGDCAKRFLFEFDFITFPLLSAILFAFLAILYFYILKTKTN